MSFFYIWSQVALFEVTEFKPDMETDSRLNMLLADVFYKFTLGVASRTQPLRGGALGAGAIAVGANVGPASVSPTGGPSVVPGAPAQYGGRGAPSQSAVNLKLPQGSRYAPSRDPAMILQQQLQAQQAQQHQPAVPGRIPYTSQQLQVQQQQQLMMSRATQQAQQAQQQGQYQRPFAGANDGSFGGAQGGMRAQQGSQARLGASQHAYFAQDDTLSVSSGGTGTGPSDYSLASGLQGMQVSPPSPAMSHSESLQRGQGSRPQPIITQHGSSSNLDSGALFSPPDTQNSGSTQGAFFRPSSMLNPGAATFQSDSNKWANYSANAASQNTPTSGGTQATSVPFVPSADWGAAQADSARYSVFTNSTSSLTLGAHSAPTSVVSTPHGHNAHAAASMFPSHYSAHGSVHNNGIHAGNNSNSFRGGLGDLSSPFDDAMDKLIGVTNIGHIPSFDDPLDPQYQED
jgi:hypothetical protein